MKKINITRVLLAGIVAAIVFIVIEFLFEGIVIPVQRNLKDD